MDINRTTILTNAITSTSSCHSASSSKTSLSSTPKAHNNGLAAIKLISAGSTIISTSKPYHIILENSLVGTVCSWCLLSPSPQSLKRCSRCHTLHYCSIVCQKQHWTTHKNECPTLAKLSQMQMPGPLPTPVRALIEVLVRPDGGKLWMGLESHEEELKGVKGEGGWDDVVLQARGAVMYSDLGESYLGRAIGLLCRMKTNSFRFTSSTASGILFDPYLAMANHSCYPNAELSCEGRELRVTALREIEEGEQIFITYVDEDLLGQERRKMLRERHFFECGCERCVSEKEGRDGDPE